MPTNDERTAARQSTTLCGKPHNGTIHRGRLAPCRTCPEADKVSPIVELLVINGSVAVAVSGALDQEDRAFRLDSQRCRDIMIGGDSLKLAFRINERNVVTLFQKCEDWFDFEIVRDDIFSDLKRQVFLNDPRLCHEGAGSTPDFDGFVPNVIGPK
jgi:hypothetical protein